MASETSSNTGSTTSSGYILVPRLPKTDPQKIFHYTDLQRSKPTRANDPYEYLQGWGNRHQSEVIPGTLPAGQNNPQENRFGLYTEGITYSAFAAPRQKNVSTYMYRCRPAAAHGIPPPCILAKHKLMRNPRWLPPNHHQGKHRKLLSVLQS
jgi:homogentisate 1,2-dioxygenase